MLEYYDLAVEWLSMMLGGSAVLVCLYRRLFSRYVFINLYLMAVVAFTTGCYYIRSSYGFESPQYFYFYYTGDAITIILCYLLVGSLFDQLLHESAFARYVRPTLLLAFLIIVGVSAGFLAGSLDRFYSRFIFEFQQNMYFVGVLLTLLLWMSMTYLRVGNRQFVLLVSGLGAYFASHAANYAMQFLFPSLESALTRVPPLAYNLMVLLWLYSFWRVPEGETVLPERALVPGEPVAVPIGRQ